MLWIKFQRLSITFFFFHEFFSSFSLCSVRVSINPEKIFCFVVKKFSLSPLTFSLSWLLADKFLLAIRLHNTSIHNDSDSIFYESLCRSESMRKEKLSIFLNPYWKSFEIFPLKSLELLFRKRKGQGNIYSGSLFILLF